jgi:multidrug transporter EmrE-like cation transporter
MHKEWQTAMSALGLILTVVSAFLVVIANLLLRQAMNTSGFNFSFAHFVRLLLKPSFVLGLILYFASMVVWFKVLAMESLSSCYPILVSISFLGVTLGAVFLFKEPLPLVKIAGIVTILFGIILVVRA